MLWSCVVPARLLIVRRQSDTIAASCGWQQGDYQVSAKATASASIYRICSCWRHGGLTLLKPGGRPIVQPAGGLCPPAGCLLTKS
jgi:hypothetical protein